MNHLIKRITSFLMAAVLILNLGIITSYAEPEWPSDVGIMAEAGIIMDADSGAVLFGQQIHTSNPPASITKLLTALVIAENCSMDEIVTFSHDAVYNIEAGAGNKLSLEEGDQLTVEDCLHLMLLISSNQSANALAEHAAGSREAFVDMMNQKTAELGCSPEETRFANPSGLNDENQYVSAYDMALIAAAAFKNEDVLRISSTKRYSVPATINNPQGASISMEHRLLMTDNTDSEFYCEGAVAGKTGWTSIAGNTLVTYAERNGRRIISVILKGSQPQYYLDAKNTLDFGFASFKNESIKNSETFLQEQLELEIGGAVYPAAQLYLEDTFITIPGTAQFSDAQRTLITDLPQDHPAAAVGQLRYTYNERMIGSAYIYDSQLEEELAAQEAAAQASREAEEASRQESEQTGERPDGNQLPDETLSGQTNPNSADSDSQGGGFRMSSAQIGVLAAVICAGVLIGAVVLIAVKKKKQERLEREQRRERRRQRLQEIGYNEEQFEELMRKRRENSKKESD